MVSKQKNSFRLVRLGVETYKENIIFVRSDCNVCTSEGSALPTRVLVKHKNKSIVATLGIIYSDLLKHGETSLSETAFKRLNVKEGDRISVSHLLPINSLSHVRAKIYGNKLSKTAIQEIVNDVNSGLYSDIELAAFITACAGEHLDLNEITNLTKAMATTGKQLHWEKKIVMDKHCVGGLPANRTTPIVVAIIAEAGLTIPKTSSRAITSPAGTADTMEVFTNVNLTQEQIKKVVNQQNACLAWGGVAELSPTDDILITVEKALDIDSEGQMIASVLSKKAAAGSTHVVIDIPVGKTAKVRTEEDALKLQYYFKAVGKSMGLSIEVMITEGSQPVGRGIGPALEAFDVLSVLQNKKDAPIDLKEKSISIAATMLELSKKAKKGDGVNMARKILESGKAFERFKSICLAQGRYDKPALAKYKKHIYATKSGVVKEIDNRKLAKIAKLAGAPQSPASGIYFDAPLGKKIKKGEFLFTVYAEGKNELNYALEFLESSNHIVTIG